MEPEIGVGWGQKQLYAAEARIKWNTCSWQLSKPISGRYLLHLLIVSVAKLCSWRVLAAALSMEGLPLKHQISIRVPLGWGFVFKTTKVLLPDDTQNDIQCAVSGRGVKLLNLNLMGKLWWASSVGSGWSISHQWLERETFYFSPQPFSKRLEM